MNCRLSTSGNGDAGGSPQGDIGGICRLASGSSTYSVVIGVPRAASVAVAEMSRLSRTPVAGAAGGARAGEESRIREEARRSLEYCILM